MKKIFVCSAEVSGNSLPLRKRGISGAFVSCVLQGSDLKSALNEAEATLMEDGYEIVDFDQVVLYEPEDWENGNEIKKLASLAAEEKGVHYSEFQCWGC